MSLPYEDSYVGQLRAVVGDRKLITPGARAIIRDGEGRVLFVRRSDNGAWALPAGTMELDESVWDCLRREVWEETGIEVVAATVIAIYSEPRFAFTNAFGGRHQMLSFVFRVDTWTGTLVRQTDETVDAEFFARDHLPDTAALYRETLDDLDRFDGRLILK